MITAAEGETWRDTPTRTINAGGVTFAYRELGASTDVPLIVLPHFTAVLDDRDPRVIDGIAARRRVIAFDDRVIGASSGCVPLCGSSTRTAPRTRAPRRRTTRSDLPVSAVGHGTGLNITVMSHADGLNYGIVADRDAADDAWPLATAIDRAHSELLTLATTSAR